MRRLGEGTVQKIQELLASGQSHRRIAALLGVSRSPVDNIANGTHTSQRRRREEPFRPVKTEPVWCPGCCAFIVLSPCVACLAKKEKGNRKQESDKALSPAICSLLPSLFLGINLHGKARERYLAIRKTKQ